MTDPLLAIVIPVFRHSVLMVDAIESALAQEVPFGIRILIVNDGCPHPETDEIGRAYARAYPDRITYLRKANGGLSSARNHGIAHVLDHLPSVRAVYMLDADNALRPQAMARAMAALEADPAAGWIYPDIDMRGLVSGHDYSGPYSVLLHLAMNTCEAGSLIRRAVFEAGVLFDTRFQAGFEDWDFFLTAVEAGFRGKSIEGFGFLYRKRPESMLAESERARAPILAQLRAKHRALFAPRAMLALEQDEAPRYAFVLADLGEVWITTDPLAPADPLTLDAFLLRFWQARSAPGHVPFPPLIVVTRSEALAEMAGHGMIHGLLWQLETMLEQVHLAGIRGRAAEGDRMGLRLLPEGVQGADEAALLMISTELMRASAQETGEDWLGTLLSPAPKPRVVLAEVSLSEAPQALAAGGAGQALLTLLAALRAAPWAEGAAIGHWRAPDLQRRAASHRILRQRLGQESVLPSLRGTGRHLGLLLSILEFGGVEKVALNLARAFAERGWSVHLVLVGTRDAAVTAEWRAVLASVTFLGDGDFAPWGGGAQSYFGTEIPRWASHGNHARLIALLSGLDAVIDLHSGAAVAVMGQLKRQGVVTASSLHLADLSPMGRPTGNPFLSLAYEHAFDLFLPCSLALGDWLHGIGIPEDKILPVPNAPGFPLPSAARAGLLAARTAPERLRALYIGRLDAQKGIERLGEVIARSAHLPIEWRVIGKAILTEGAPPLPSAIRAVLQPPVATPEALAAAYAEADLLVLLSDYEGLPLTILEAMRQGVVPIATDVGAVSEVVGETTGVLLPLAGAVEACLAALTDLAADRGRLGQLARGAAEAMAGRDWASATEPLAEALVRLTATRQATADADLAPPAHVAPLDTAAEESPRLDLTPEGWRDLAPGTAEIAAYETHAGFVQFGAPEEAGIRATVEARTNRRRDDRGQRVLSLRPQGTALGRAQPWFTWELMLTGVDLADFAALDWSLRYGLGRPRNLYAQFMLDGGGEHLAIDIGTLRGSDMGTVIPLTLRLRQIPRDVLRKIATVRLVLSTDGELLPFDLLDFAVHGRS